MTKIMQGKNPERLKKFRTDEAIAAYQAVENASIRLDEAVYHLERTLAMGVDMYRYYATTSKIDNQMELKRRRLEGAGRLPRDKET